MSKLMTTNQSSSDRMVRSTCQPFFLDVGACKTPWVGLHSQPATVGCLVWGPHVQTWVHRFNKHLFSLLAFFFPLTTHLNTYFHVVTITAWKIISNFRVFFLSLVIYWKHYPHYLSIFKLIIFVPEWQLWVTGRPQFTCSGKAVLLLYQLSISFFQWTCQGLDFDKTFQFRWYHLALSPPHSTSLFTGGYSR